MISPLPLTASLFLISLLCCFLGIASAMRQGAPGARPFSFLAFACAIYAAGAALELSAMMLSRIVFWIKVEYIGILLMEPLWVLYALDFAQVRVADRRILALLFVEPAASLALLWTTELHGLFYARYWLRGATPFPLIEIAHGPAYWVHTAAMWVHVRRSGSSFSRATRCDPRRPCGGAPSSPWEACSSPSRPTSS